MKNIIKRVVTVALAAVTLISSLTVGSVDASALKLKEANNWGGAFIAKDFVNLELNPDTTIMNVEVRMSKANARPERYVHIKHSIDLSDPNIKEVGGGMSNFHLLGYSRLYPNKVFAEFYYKYKGKYRLADGLVDVSDIQGDILCNFRMIYFSTTIKGDRSDRVEVINTMTGWTKKIKGGSTIKVIGYAVKDGTPYYLFNKTLTDKKTGKKAKTTFAVQITDTHGEEFSMFGN